MDSACHLPWTGFRFDITSLPPPFPLAIVILSPCLCLLVLALRLFLPLSHRPREDPSQLPELFLHVLALFLVEMMFDRSVKKVRSEDVRQSTIIRKLHHAGKFSFGQKDMALLLTSFDPFPESQKALRDRAIF